MKKLLCLTFLITLLSACQNSAKQAEQTVRDFALAIKNPKSNLDSLYKDYAIWGIPEWGMKTTIEDLSSADSIEIVSSRLISHNEKIDTCEVLCNNFIRKNEIKIKNKVKFIVAVHNGKSQIITSYGLVQLKPEYKKILFDAGAIDNNMEDRTYAACWSDYSKFIEYSKLKYGDDLTNVQFHKNEYEDFLKGLAEYRNQQLMEGKIAPDQQMENMLYLRYRR